MSHVKVPSKSWYETSVVSLFGRLPMPVLLAANGIAVMIPCLFCIVPIVFEEKRHCSHSTFSNFWNFFPIPPSLYHFGA